MTRDEINRKISEIRRVWIELLGSTFVVDWCVDAHWPTLFDEMPMPHLWKNPDGTWYCDPDISGDWEVSDCDTSGEAVCLAWIKWKEAQ